MSQLRPSQHIKYKKEVWEHTSNKKQLIQLWWITSGMIYMDQYLVSDCLSERKSRAPPSVEPPDECFSNLYCGTYYHQ